MSDQTKIQLSPFEMDLLNNTEWILTKNQIVKKAQQLLSEVQENILQLANGSSINLPHEVLSISPKISKGENYNGLPWLMLDYPRYFEKQRIFAIRTMFWWGKFFSTTLHLSGDYKEGYSSAIVRSYEALCSNEFFTCVHDEQWHHHFDKENYLPVRSFSATEFADHINRRSFVKLSCQLSFLQWDNAPGLLTGNFMRITGWLG